MIDPQANVAPIAVAQMNIKTVQTNGDFNFISNCRRKLSSFQKRFFVPVIVEQSRCRCLFLPV
jgi:hypothetical protein